MENINEKSTLACNGTLKFICAQCPTLTAHLLTVLLIDRGSIFAK